MFESQQTIFATAMLLHHWRAQRPSNQDDVQSSVTERLAVDVFLFNFLPRYVTLSWLHFKWHILYKSTPIEFWVPSHRGTNALPVDKSLRSLAVEANSPTDYHYYCEYEMLGINKKKIVKP
jgi:hypothetical protein